MGRGGSATAQQQLAVADPDRPRFHVHPPQGWMNDPNGPVFYRGRYHMFYQHLPNACEWAFGIVWGHAVSSDLVHWQHLPPALVPTPGTLDADGCFSGSCVLDSDGTPVILYTGVRLRSNLEAGPLPPPEQDLGMVWVESQLAAVPEDPDDELLVRWRKVESPFLHLPPADLQLTGWRDPFVFTTNTAATPTDDSGFNANGFSRAIRMLIGSGLKGQGGTALVYKSTSLFGGWELEGTLCEARDTDTGVVWECPLLVPLDPVPRNLRAPAKKAPPRWLLCPAHHEGEEGSTCEGSEEAGSGHGFGSCDRISQAAKRSSSTPQLTRQGSASAAAAAPAAGGGRGVVDAAAEAAAAGGQASAAEAAEAFAFAVAAHGSSDSFAFEPDLNMEGFQLGEEAASAVTAWQQASSAGGSPAGSPVAAAAAPAAAGSAAAAAAAAVGPASDLDGPSDVAALPPGRGRHPVAGAKLSIDSAASLGHWSQAPSESLSPNESLSAVPSSAGTSPQPHSSPERPLPLHGGVPRPPQLQLHGQPPPAGQLQSPQRQRQRSRSRGLSPGLSPGRRQQAAQPGQHAQHEDEEDRFAAAFSRLSMRGIRARQRSVDRVNSRRGSHAALAALAAPHEDEDGGAPDTPPPPPEQQWHFFTVSPDAPTNPVLYWMGHVVEGEGEMPRFQLEGAKGPYRLDLGDVLYAPNVCQDGQGRWLMWGWLQERRKMGSYNYAGCLTLPRVLHCTEDGRLVQAPIPELARLRQGAGQHQHGLHVPAEVTVPLQAPPAAAALDIELTLDRGTAFAAGLLFRSYEAEAEGGTALIYDWERNALEAIFNVPPNWQPAAAPQSAKYSAAGELGEAFDPALLLTPRPGMLLAQGGFSRTPSVLFSPNGFESLSASQAATPRTATDSLAGEMSSSFLSPQRSSISIVGAAPHPPAMDLGIPGLEPPPHLVDVGGGPGSGVLAAGSSGPFSSSMPGSLSARSLSAIGAGLMGAAPGTARGFEAGSLPGTARGFEVGSLPTGGGTGLYRSVSDGRAALAAGLPRTSSHPALQTYGSLPRQAAAVLSPASRSPRPVGADTDADLDFLLDELAAPMREAPPPPVEPRRVGGPLPLMRGNEPIHLRIIVDHSCVEVYTGTGEALSTRIYRGSAPEGATDAGISFISFGGTARVQRCTTWEMGSAWEAPEAAATAKMAAAAGHAAPSPQRAAVLAATSRGGSGQASPAAAPPLAGPEGGGQRSAAAAAASAAAADALLDGMVMCIDPQCSAAMVGAFAG